jgi:hypothetical protein
MIHRTRACRHKSLVGTGDLAIEGEITSGPARNAEPFWQGTLKVLVVVTFVHRPGQKVLLSGTPAILSTENRQQEAPA